MKRALADLSFSDFFWQVTTIFAAVIFSTFLAIAAFSTNLALASAFSDIAVGPSVPKYSYICSHLSAADLRPSFQGHLLSSYNYARFILVQKTLSWDTKKVSLRSQREILGHALAKRFRAGEDHAVWSKKLGFALTKDLSGVEMLLVHRFLAG